MTYINISYIAANDHIDRDTVIDALRALDISENQKHETFQAIYNLRPEGVSFDDSKAEDDANSLKKVLRKLGIPHRQSDAPTAKNAA